MKKIMFVLSISLVIVCFTTITNLKEAHASLVEAPWNVSALEAGYYSWDGSIQWFHKDRVTVSLATSNGMHIQITEERNTFQALWQVTIAFH